MVKKHDPWLEVTKGSRDPKNIADALILNPLKEDKEKTSGFGENVLIWAAIIAFVVVAGTVQAIAGWVSTF